MTRWVRRFDTLPTAIKWIVIVGAAVVVLTAIDAGGADDENAAGPATATRATAPLPPTTTSGTVVPRTVKRPQPRPQPRARRASRQTPLRRLKVALRPLHASAAVTSGLVLVYADTPTGGFQGASTGDLNDAAGDIFTAIYGVGGFGRGSEVTFRGGLVDTTTGAPLPNEKTGVYRMSAEQAGAIRWHDDNRLLYVDWRNFRAFAHPALKQDENGIDPR